MSVDVVVKGTKSAIIVRGTSSDLKRVSTSSFCGGGGG